MSKENIYYDVYPRIVPTNKQSIITIKPLYSHCSFKADAYYQTAFIPTCGYSNQTAIVVTPRVKAQPIEGKITLNCNFESEQEYLIILEEVTNDEVKCLAFFTLYALEPDLFELKPFKGDTHMHSYRSDGKESPAFVAASSRKIGMDFIAITDHYIYTPSLEAIDAFRDIEIDLRMYPGEEIHAPKNSVHMVNFGGDFSVNELFKSDTYMKEVKDLEATLDYLPKDIDRYTYASCLWCFNKIKEGNGLGVFCHPYWFCIIQYGVPEKLVDLLIENQPFDALEIIGGFFRFQLESNTLAVARYHEERVKGRQIPIVGASDSHGSAADLYGWYYTIVFAKSAERDDIIKGIKKLYSVAVESVPGEATRAFGPFRLVKYSQFLIREIFPSHDNLCKYEGELMQAYIAGDENAKEDLKKCKGKTEALLNKIWAKEKSA